MNFSMNNTVPEPDRTFEVPGFNNVPPAPATPVPPGMGVLTETHRLDDEVVDHSNTTPYGFPEDGVSGIHLDAQRR